MKKCDEPKLCNKMCFQCLKTRIWIQYDRYRLNGSTDFHENFTDYGVVWDKLKIIHNIYFQFRNSFVYIHSCSRFSADFIRQHNYQKKIDKFKNSTIIMRGMRKIKKNIY